MENNVDDTGYELLHQLNQKAHEIISMTLIGKAIMFFSFALTLFFLSSGVLFKPNVYTLF